MNYQTEFPDFPAADMPRDIPAGLVDSSWANDACPAFTVWEDDNAGMFQRVTLWIDWADISKREVQGGKRFMLTLIAEDGRIEPVDLAQSDDWAEMRKEVEFIRDNIADILTLARYFAALIRAEYTAEELQEVNRLNRTPEYAAACATQDFRDANAYMFGALAALYFDCPDVADQATADKMNHAWQIAKETGFAA